MPGCILVHSAGISDLTRERTITKKNRIFLSGALVLSLAFLWWGVRVSKRPKFSVQLRGDGIALSIAGTGDWLTRDAITRERADRSFAGISEIVKNASLGLTTLEEDLLDKESASTRGGSESPRWPHGTKRDAESLRRCGFTVVSLANNHAADYGIEGMRQTGEILDHEGIPHVGSGEDLQHANGQVYVGSKPIRVAVIAATTSAEPQSRATYTQGEILGRPGVNVLRYSPKVTVDPSTFATLKRSGIAVHSNASDPDQLILSGTVINKGSKTIVEFLANEQDRDGILAQIKNARSNADVVVLMLHSHEPGDRSETPAEFVQRFARASIDAGASLVVGDGPHRLRGIESYRGGVIFYSLGNFVFESGGIDPSAADQYDRGTDLYELALGSLGDSQTQSAPKAEEAVWWESVIATTSFEHGVVNSIQLQPIDLGVNLPLAQRGTPRLADPLLGGEILRRLVRLSPALGAAMRVENGTGFVDFSQNR